MKYNYPPLKGICKKAIEKGWCTGCNRLELLEFRGLKECKYVKEPTVEDYIEQIKLNLGGKK